MLLNRLSLISSSLAMHDSYARAVWHHSVEGSSGDNALSAEKLDARGIGTSSGTFSVHLLTTSGPSGNTMSPAQTSVGSGTATRPGAVPVTRCSRGPQRTF